MSNYRAADCGETYGLGQRPALSNGNGITLLNTERGGNVGGDVVMALLVTVVLGDEVEVLATDDEGTVHLGGDDGTGQDTATDRDESSEGALLVCRAQSEISDIFESRRSRVPELPLLQICHIFSSHCRNCAIVHHIPNPVLPLPQKNPELR